ncbi:MAG: polyprenyl synthetase family protein, partial [Propionibacteriaceae bacterium]
MQPSDPLSSAFCHAIAQQLSDFLDTCAAAVADPAVLPLVDLARHATAGGKRVRPAFCAWGYVAATGTEPPAAVLQAAASLDLLHVSALVHDDIIDASDTRRGQPSAHRQLEQHHRCAAGRGDSAIFGRNSAILLGDLLWAWSAQLYESAPLPASALSAGRGVLAATRTEVTQGQYLDLWAETLPLTDPGALAHALKIIEYKTSRYTVIRPVQLGAVLGGAEPEVLDGLAQFGSALGCAFQLRDDLLGIFGDETKTGKPAGDDLREGKRTVVIAEAMTNLASPAATRLHALL